MLDVSTLAAEVSRLRNSIQHLQSTQADLRAYLLAEPDKDEDGEVKAALRENTEVIASQEERIGMLRQVLVHKVGEDSLAHYGFAEQKQSPGSHRSAEAGAPPISHASYPEVQEADGGFYL